MRLREGREFFEGTENPKGKSAATVNEIRSSRPGKNCGVRFREPEGREKKKRSSLSLEGSEKW